MAIIQASIYYNRLYNLSKLHGHIVVMINKLSSFFQKVIIQTCACPIVHIVSVKWLFDGRSAFLPLVMDIFTLFICLNNIKC